VAISRSRLPAPCTRAGHRRSRQTGRRCENPARLELLFACAGKRATCAHPVRALAMVPIPLRASSRLPHLVAAPTLVRVRPVLADLERSSSAAIIHPIWSTAEEDRRPRPTTSARPRQAQRRRTLQAVSGRAGPQRVDTQSSSALPYAGSQSGSISGEGRFKADATRSADPGVSPPPHNKDQPFRPYVAFLLMAMSRRLVYRTLGSPDDDTALERMGVLRLRAKIVIARYGKWLAWCLKAELCVRSWRVGASSTRSVRTTATRLTRSIRRVQLARASPSTWIVADCRSIQAIR